MTSNLHLIVTSASVVEVLSVDIYFYKTVDSTKHFFISVKKNCSNIMTLPNFKRRGNFSAFIMDGLMIKHNQAILQPHVRSDTPHGMTVIFK